MLLLLDNYDSFTYNIYQMLRNLGAEVEVIRNDKTSVKEIQSKNYKGIIISPGPGLPKDAGITEEVIRELGGKLPILGVCLVIRRSVKCSAAKLFAQMRLSMAKPPPFAITAQVSIAISLPMRRSHAIIPLSLNAKACRRYLRSRVNSMTA